MCQKYLPLLCRTALFHSVDACGIAAVLSCLNAVERHYEKDEYLLHEGNVTEVFGVVLSGSVMVVQDDWWGNRNIRALLSEGEVFAQSFACVKDAPLDVSVAASKECAVLWLNAKRLLTICLLCPPAPYPNDAESAIKHGICKYEAGRETDPRKPPHHKGKAIVILILRGKKKQ